MKSKKKNIKLLLSFLGTISLGASLTPMFLSLNNNQVVSLNASNINDQTKSGYEYVEGDVSSNKEFTFPDIDSKLFDIELPNLTQSRLNGFLAGNQALFPVVQHIQEVKKRECFLGPLTGFAYTENDKYIGRCVITCTVYVGENYKNAVSCFIQLHGFKPVPPPKPGQSVVPGENGLIEDESSNTALYIGIGVGSAVLLIAVIILLIIMFKKRKKQVNRQPTKLSTNSANKAPMQKNLLGGPSASTQKPGPNGPMGSNGRPGPMGSNGRPGSMSPNGRPGPMGPNNMSGGPSKPGINRPMPPPPPKIEINAPPKSLAPKKK